MAPVAPKGCPSAMAPPLTLTLSWGTPSLFIHIKGTTANASLTSNRSMSPISMPAFARALRVAGTGPVSMMIGSSPHTAMLRTRARGLQSQGLALLRAGQHDAGRTVDDARAVAGRVYVRDPFDLGVPHAYQAIERESGTHRLEAGGKCPQRVDGGSRSGQLVLVQEHQAVLVPNRHQALVEGTTPLCLGTAVLALDGKGVDVASGEALDGCDEVGRDALGHASRR